MRMKSIRPGGLLRRNLPSPSCAADSLRPLARASMMACLAWPFAEFNWFFTVFAAAPGIKLLNSVGTPFTSESAVLTPGTVDSLSAFTFLPSDRRSLAMRPSASLNAAALRSSLRAAAFCQPVLCEGRRGVVTRLERERGLPQIPSDHDRNELWLAGYPPGGRSVVGEDEAVRTVGRGVVLGQHHQVAS